MIKNLKISQFYISTGLLILSLVVFHMFINILNKNTINKFQMVNVNQAEQAHNKIKSFSEQYIKIAQENKEFNEDIQLDIFSAITNEYSFVDYTEDYFSSKAYSSQVDNLKDALFNYQKSLYSKDTSEIENIQKSLYELNTQYNIYIQNYK